MVKTILFTSISGLGAVHEYQDFVKDNPEMEIISVNVLNHNFILLTYRY